MYLSRVLTGLKVARIFFHDKFGSAAGNKSTLYLGLHNIHTDMRADNNLGIKLTKNIQIPTRYSNINVPGCSIGSKIRRFRIAKDISMNELAKIAGLNPHSLDAN